MAIDIIDCFTRDRAGHEYKISLAQRKAGNFEIIGCSGYLTTLTDTIERSMDDSTVGAMLIHAISNEGLDLNSAINCAKQVGNTAQVLCSACLRQPTCSKESDENIRGLRERFYESKSLTLIDESRTC